MSSNTPPASSASGEYTPSDDIDDSLICGQESLPVPCIQTQDLLDGAESEENDNGAPSAFSMMLAGASRAAGASSSHGLGGNSGNNTDIPDNVDPESVPKAPSSAYFMWQDSQRSQMREEHPEASIGQLGKLMGGKWKEMGSEGQGEWYEKARLAKEEYQEACKALGITTGQAKAIRSAFKASQKRQHSAAAAEREELPDLSEQVIESLPSAPLTAYFEFSKQQRAKGKRNAAEISALWKQLSESEKEALQSARTDRLAEYRTTLEKLGLSESQARRLRAGERAGDVPGEEVEEDPVALTLPSHRVKKLIKMDKEFAERRIRFHKKAVSLITKTAELFLEQAANHVARITTSKKRGTMLPSDFARAVGTQGDLSFLKLPMRSELARMDPEVASSLQNARARNEKSNKRRNEAAMLVRATMEVAAERAAERRAKALASFGTPGSSSTRTSKFGDDGASLANQAAGEGSAAAAAAAGAADAPSKGIVAMFSKARAAGKTGKRSMDTPKYDDVKQQERKRRKRRVLQDSDDEEEEEDEQEEEQEKRLEEQDVDEPISASQSLAMTTSS